MSPRGYFPGDNVVLSGPSARNLRGALADYCQGAEARYVAVLEESGAILTDFGGPLPHADEIGALANGAFFAVQELARRLGETSCEGFFHQGAGTHFYICPLTDHCFLLTVFGKDSRLGIVRSAIARAAPAIRENLTNLYTTPLPDLPQDGDFSFEETFSLSPQPPFG